jgi:hypothetical protein
MSVGYQAELTRDEHIGQPGTSLGSAPGGQLIAHFIGSLSVIFCKIFITKPAVSACQRSKEVRFILFQAILSFPLMQFGQVIMKVRVTAIVPIDPLQKLLGLIAPVLGQIQLRQIRQR